MKNIFYYALILLFISNCTLNKVIKHHGVHFLEKKNKELMINKSNKNDIIKLLGPPSTTSSFDQDMLIYIERSSSSSKILKLGKRKLLENNVLILEINSKGLLTKKIFLNKENMNTLKFSEDFTAMDYSKRTFVYDFLSTMRKKINDPLGKRD